MVQTSGVFYWTVVEKSSDPFLLHRLVGEPETLCMHPSLEMVQKHLSFVICSLADSRPNRRLQS